MNLIDAQSDEISMPENTEYEVQQKQQQNIIQHVSEI